MKWDLIPIRLKDSLTLLWFFYACTDVGPFLGGLINALLTGETVSWVTGISAMLKSKWVSTLAVNELDQINQLRVVINLITDLSEMHTDTAFCIHSGVSQS